MDHDTKTTRMALIVCFTGIPTFMVYKIASIPWYTFILFAAIFFVLSIKIVDSIMKKSSIFTLHINPQYLRNIRQRLPKEDYRKFLKRSIGTIEAMIISEAEKGNPRNPELEEKLRLLEAERDKIKQ